MPVPTLISAFVTPGFYELLLLLIVGVPIILVLVVIVSQVKRRSQAPNLLGADLSIPYDSPEARAIGFTKNSIFILIALHYLSIGIYTSVYLCLAHRYMPKLRRDDPSGAYALMAHLVPFYNIYWIFFHHLRLCDRINEQRQFRELDQKLWLRNMSIVKNTLLLVAIGASLFEQLEMSGLLFLLNYLIVTPIYLGSLQRAINELAILAYMDNLADSVSKVDNPR